MNFMIADDHTRAKTYRMLSLESFVSVRDDFVSKTLVDFEPMERFENRKDMIKPGCFRGNTSCRVYLELNNTAY